jgi:hypothetical protein
MDDVPLFFFHFNSDQSYWMKGSFSSFKGFLSATPLGNILRRAEKEIEFGREKSYCHYRKFI